jgi:malonate transporter and related proteins
MSHIILLALLPVLFVLLLGYSAGKFKVIDNHHVEGLNTLLMSYALPASLFAVTGSAPRQEMLAQWPFVVIVGGAMVSVYVLWYLARLYLLKCSSSEAALEALTISLPNAAAIGLPVAAALLGPAL